MSTSSCQATKLTQVQFPQNMSTPRHVKDRNRKIPRKGEDPFVRIPASPLQKRSRTSLASSAVEDAIGQEAMSGVSENKVNPIHYWTRKGSWPREYFDQTKKDFRKDFEKDSWVQKYWEAESNMNHLFARKKSSSSLRGKKGNPVLVRLALRHLAIKSQGKLKVLPTNVRATPPYLRPRAASWASPI